MPRNPYNQPEPAEWATMSPKLRKRWRKAHWRPNEWMVVVPLRRFATRKENQRLHGLAGSGMGKLASKLEKTNPYKAERPEGWKALPKSTRRAWNREQWEDPAPVRSLKRGVTSSTWSAQRPADWFSLSSAEKTAWNKANTPRKHTVALPPKDLQMKTNPRRRCNPRARALTPRQLARERVADRAERKPRGRTPRRCQHRRRERRG